MNTTNNIHTKTINDVNDIQNIVFDNSSKINENEYITIQNKLKNIFEYSNSSKIIVEGQDEIIERLHNIIISYQTRVTILEQRETIIEQQNTIIELMTNDSELALIRFNKTINELKLQHIKDKIILQLEHNKIVNELKLKII
jgi:hypothetical protein